MPGSDERIRMSAGVEPAQAGMRLDQAAAELFGDFSRARLQKWIRGGELRVDGQVLKPTYRVHGGERLELDAEPEYREDVLPERIPLDIIHADDDIIVLDKPPGLVVHPAAGNLDGTLQNALLNFDPRLAALPRAGIVHRLDKDTSGVMVVARSLKAHASLVAQLQDRSMSREYEAVVHGITRKQGTIEAPIGRNPHERQRMAVVPGGRPAVSHYRLLNAFRHFSHVRVALESGRTHQIRVHMQHIGHPLVGDPQYGRKTPAPKQLSAGAYEAVSQFPRQALHACKLSLKHPEKQVQCEFHAPVAEDLAGLIRVLEATDV